MPRKKAGRAGQQSDADLHAEIIAGRLDDLDGIEILCGIPCFENARTIGNVVRAVEAGLRRAFPGVPAAIVVSDGGSEDGTAQAALEASTAPDEDLLLIDPKAPAPARIVLRYEGISGKGSAFRSIFATAAHTGVRACAVFDSDLRSITPGWVENLLKPVLTSGQDFVAPIYARHKYDGTITNSIAFPLTAALYGYRVRQPIGGEFGFSGKLASYWSDQDVWETDVARYGIDIWMTTTAIVQGFRICQAQLGAKVHDVKDPGAHLGPMFRQVVGSLFALAGRYVDKWQRVEEILSVPTYGFRAATSAEEIRIRAGRLTWRFIEGYMRYEKLWRDVLAAETLSAVVRATDEAAEKTEGFVLPVELWAHIVYDYLVAFSAAEIDASELLDSMIPLYFARTATFVQEASSDDQQAAEERIGRYADLFLDRKDYLRRRWAAAGVKRSLAEQTVPPGAPVQAQAEAEEVLGAQSD
jgi:glycosyltransferase involved in cell wall biosynthesis